MLASVLAPPAAAESPTKPVSDGSNLMYFFNPQSGTIKRAAADAETSGGSNRSLAVKELNDG